ncbi:C6 transcription factor [Paecilomyces variotii No. 5]|uniref:C6 transcription factor n=1 Tax=Byssochlamys spectabilis (strain No. 5 / NBRC 109023) TaxID=1356009 RepID=V5FYI9_BYSSN|nr:C6 transcription factor [Paecilomyces variotii No. 5]
MSLSSDDKGSRSFRKRARKACEPCRQRKRKCNGAQPCSSCVRFEYDCFYHSRAREPVIEPVNVTPSQPAGPTPKLTANDQSFVQSLEANSGAAFVRRLGLAIDPANAPRSHLFAWNVGPRSSSLASRGSAPTRIVDIISKTDIRFLASVYFEKVDPCYGFIDRDSFFQHVGARWSSPPATDVYDAVICGVAALGSYFSRQTPPEVETALAQLGRSILENDSTSEVPSIDIITGWVCRVVYLRMTATPLTAWVASCTAMHLIEAAGLYYEPTNLPKTVLSPAVMGDPDMRRRLVGVAEHLNTWISFDLGLPRVSFQQQRSTTIPLSPRPGDYTDKLLSLLPVSASLDPSEPQDDSNLYSTLTQIVQSQDHQPPLIMAQCNLLLCILRRIHSQGGHLPSIIMDEPGIDAVLEFMKKTLRAARRMADTINPWHNMANVPFQVTCTLIVIDSRASLRLLKEAMQTLHHLTSTFDTPVLKEACSTAHLLLWLHYKRRSEDVDIVGDILASDIPKPLAMDMGNENLAPSNEVELAWVDSLTADMPSLHDIDIDQLLSGDVLFNSA